MVWFIIILLSFPNYNLKKAQILAVFFVIYYQSDSAETPEHLFVITVEVRGNLTDTLLAGSLAKALCCILSVKSYVPHCLAFSKIKKTLGGEMKNVMNPLWVLSPFLFGVTVCPWCVWNMLLLCWILLMIDYFLEITVAHFTAIRLAKLFFKSVTFRH